MKEARINEIYFPGGINTVPSLKNRTIPNTRNDKTRYEIFFGIEPSVKNLKIQGTRSFLRSPEVYRKNIRADKARLGVSVGYDHYGYIVLVIG